MKKVLCAILVVMFALCLTACSSDWKTTVTDYSGEVSSNGGFLVEKGEYVYFINGSVDSTVDNTFGTPVKGALVRAKKSSLGTETTAEVVVPKLIFATGKGEGYGFFIFGDYVYYTSPCDNKNKQGVVRNTELEFLRTKLDGTGTQTIAIIADLATPHRFVKIGENVFVTAYTTDAEDSTKNVLVTYNCDTFEKVSQSNAVSSYVFPSNLDANYCYYSNVIHNDALDADESFNRLMRYKLDGSEDVEVLHGAGKYTDKDNGIGVTGVSFTPIVSTGNQLYISESFSVASGSSTSSMYYGINENELTTGDGASTSNYKKLTLLNEGTSNAAEIFVTKSVFIDLDSIIYFDSTFGVMKYDYTKKDTATFGRTKVYENSEILTYTYSFMKDGYVYMTNDSDAYLRFNLGALVDLSTGDIKTATDVKAKQINYYTVATSTSWYLPEIVGNYFLTIVSDEPYYSYVYAIDMTATDGMTDEEIEEYKTDITTVDEEQLTARLKTRVGVLSETDAESLTTYLDDNYGDD